MTAFAMRIYLFLLFCGLSFAQAQTFITQYTIDEPTVWYAFLSPYFVSQNLEITSEGILQLEAGVEVRFVDGYGILVEGRLEAMGTNVSPVRIGPISTDQGPNWNGIKLSGKRASAHLQYTDVLLAQTGLHIQGSGSDPIMIEDCTIGYGGTAILIEEEPYDFTASRNALVQNEIGLEFLTGGSFKRFLGNEICENTQYQAAMRTKEAVSITNNCWCELDLRATGQDNGILDRRTQSGLGYLDISSSANATNCNILNPTAEFVKGGGDITVVLDDYVSTQNESPWELQMRLFPQPMSTTATIELSETWRGPLSLEIFDLKGRLIFKDDYPESKRINLDRAILPNAGVYLIRLNDEKGHFASARMMVQ